MPTGRIQMWVTVSRRAETAIDIRIDRPVCLDRCFTSCFYDFGSEFGYPMVLRYSVAFGDDKRPVIRFAVEVSADVGFDVLVGQPTIADA